jgi:hydrogenase expression/formation protein HypE
VKLESCYNSGGQPKAPYRGFVKPPVLPVVVYFSSAFLCASVAKFLLVGNFEYRELLLMSEKKVVTLAHGNGGRFAHELIEKIFLPRFDNRYLSKLTDSAVLPNETTQLAFTTDSYVVRPPFFPGGDIGRLAVCGTVNDLAVVGAEPKYLSAGFIIEEGYPRSDLQRIVASMQKTAEEAGVMIVTGDTKVVPKGNADRIYINTSGIGFIAERTLLSPQSMTPGDQVIVSGTVGDHAVAIMKARGEFPITVTIESDCAPLLPLIREILARMPDGCIRVMRDPTRGGLATTLNEFTRASKLSIEIDEETIPICDEVRAVCELTGFDPLYLANEGKFVLVCAAEKTDEILELMISHPLGKNAALIGQVTEDPLSRVYLVTNAGGTRILDMLAFDMLPRIC